MALAPLGAQVRPYRDYLTPALHRRFNKASRYTLLLCYAIACWMGEWDSLLWLWFPLGYTGIRTLLLFLPALFIYVLRVAQWHVGHRHTLTRAQSFQKYFFRKETVLTTLFYISSAWIFGQVYIWSRTEKSKLAYTDAGRAHERVKLNERPLYFQYLLIALAIAQSALHLSRDYDTIDVQAMKPRADCQDAAPGAPPTRMPNPRRVLIKSFRSMLTTSASLTLFVAVAGSAVYFVGIRQLIWDYYYSFQRYFTSLSKTSRPTGIAPAAPLFAMFVVEGTLLALMWQFVNKAFDLYIAQEPLKHGVPITSDSKDPNGTLLNGLKSKKEAVKVRSGSRIRFSSTNTYPGDRFLGTSPHHRRIP
jgi:nucleoporin NDC1